MQKVPTHLKILEQEYTNPENISPDFCAQALQKFMQLDSVADNKIWTEDVGKVLS